MQLKIGAAMLATVMMAAGSYADSVTHGGTTITMDFVPIGHAGNAAQSAANRAHTRSQGDGFGSVSYQYRMGQKEVSVSQFAAARAADGRVGGGNEGFWNDGTRTVGADAPASNVSVHEAMKFANWLTTGSAVSGAYQFDAAGTTLLAVDRTAAVSAYGTVYVLPSEDEWFKAAYFKPDASGYSLYANGSDDVASVTHGTSSGWNYADGGWVNPAPNNMWAVGYGGQEQNGTYNMMGNVWEWTESAYDGTLDVVDENRTFRGGAYGDTVGTMASETRFGHFNTTQEFSVSGFRVAAIPEPSTIAFVGLFGGGLVAVRRFFRM